MNATLKEAPTKAVANPFAMHGMQGRLIVRLQRYGLLGWILFAFMLLVFVALVMLSTFAPKPVIAVDANGHVLGTMEYLAGSARTDQEVTAAAMYAAQNCLSLNAETIETDVTECMNMMNEPLYNQWLELLKTGYVSRIKQAGTRSFITFAKDGNTIMSRKDLVSVVTLKGTLTTRAYVNGQTESRDKLFALEMVLTAIPRSTVSTRGFRLDSYKDI